MEQPVVLHLNVRDDQRGGLHVKHVRIGEVLLDPFVLTQSRESGNFMLRKGESAGERQVGVYIQIRVHLDPSILTQTGGLRAMQR